MIFTHQNYRNFIKEALAEKGRDGQGYSIRGFAEKLKVSNSYLSEVLSGRKSISVDLAFRIAVKLGLTEGETQYFCLLVQLEQEKDPGYREELTARLAQMNPRRETHDLSVDAFKAIAEWYHLAILELTYLPGFRLSPESVASKLGISRVEAEMALDRLQRLELMEFGKDKRWVKTHSAILTESKIPNSAFRQYHRQMLEKAKGSLESQTPAERISASDVIAFDARHLPSVDKLSREFSREVAKLASRSKVNGSVYSLVVHFFRLSDPERK